MACCSCKWHLFSSLLSNLLCLSQHTIGVFSHVHTDVDNQAHEHIPLCHFTYILSSAARRWNFKKTHHLYREETEEIQNFRNFWLSCSGPILLLLSSLQSYFPVLTQDWLLSGSNFGWWHPSGIFLLLKYSKFWHFRKTLQVRIIHHCCFYAIRASLFVFHECGRIKFSVEECINESHSCLHLQIDSTVHL